MADLLSLSDRADIFAAFADLDDTFFQYQAAFQRRARALPAFNENVGNQYAVTEVSVRCLAVPENKDTDAQNTRSNLGSMDFSEGYVLCFVSDLITAGLATATLISVTAGLDTVKLDGLEYDIIGVNFVAPLKNLSTDRYVLGKFHVKKKLKKNNG